MPIAALNEANLHYVQLAARGPVAAGDVVLVHGLGANVAFWFFRIAPFLARSHRVTMFDLRGHGRSSMPAQGYTPLRMAEDLRELLDHLRITEPVHLVAHSYGALISLTFACLYPDRVRSLSVADVRLRTLLPELRLAAWQHWQRYLAVATSLDIELDETCNFIGFQLLEAVARRRGAQRWNRDELSELVPPTFADGGRRGAAERWLELLDRTSARQDLLGGDQLSRDALGRLHKPTLALYGERSPLLPMADRLKSLWPHARVGIVPGCGHFFPTSRPAALLEPLQAFLGESQLMPTRIENAAAL